MHACRRETGSAQDAWPGCGLARGAHQAEGSTFPERRVGPLPASAWHGHRVLRSSAPPKDHATFAAGTRSNGITTTNGST